MPGAWPGDKKRRKKRAGEKVDKSAPYDDPVAAEPGPDGATSAEDVDTSQVLGETTQPVPTEEAEEGMPATNIKSTLNAQDGSDSTIAKSSRLPEAADDIGSRNVEVEHSQTASISGPDQLATAEDPTPTKVQVALVKKTEQTAMTELAQLSTIDEENDGDKTPTKTPEVGSTSAAQGVTDPETTPKYTNIPISPALLQQPMLPAPPIAPQEIFRFDNFHYETRCRNPECRKSTHPLDGVTKICPACGPRSKVRYCSKDCLYIDIRRHFMNECGTLTIQGPIDETGLDDANKNVRPYIRHATEEMVNTVERHRQAVYFAMEPQGEYFLFDDVEEAFEYGNNPTVEQMQQARGKGKLIYVVFPPESAKAQFRRALISSLSWGTTRLSAGECAALAGMIMLDMRAHGEWTSQMCTYLVTQLGFEIRYQIPVHQQI